jgi:hypothetical protein
MTMSDAPFKAGLDVQEQLARINREHALAEQQRADANVKMQDLRLGLPRFVVSALLAVAALMASLAGLAGFIVGRAIH